VLAITAALFGALLMAMFDVGQGRQYFLDHVFGALTVNDVVSGVGKSVFFAWFIGIIACHNGLNVRGGADGVGRATTETVVTSCLAVIVSDFFLTKLFLEVL